MKTNLYQRMNIFAPDNNRVAQQIAAGFYSNGLNSPGGKFVQLLIEFQQIEQISLQIYFKDTTLKQLKHQHSTGFNVQDDVGFKQQTSDKGLKGLFQ